MIETAMAAVRVKRGGEDFNNFYLEKS